MERKINIRRFTLLGSTTEPTVLQEAERIVEECSSRGALAIDEELNRIIHSIGPETRNVLILDPIVGG